MKIAGIIAEYNPFHKGHEYHIAETRRLTGCDFVVVVMSGNYVQRGVPAILDRHTRAELACRMGADLVIELPMRDAISSAEQFAMGGVTALSAIGAEVISFGVEAVSADEHFTEQVETLATLLVSEPEEYRTALREALASGASFPVARRKAVATLRPELADLLDSPNNILAIEYAKAVKRLGISMQLLPVARIGEGYHSTEFRGIGSATGIREAFSKLLSDNVSADSVISEETPLGCSLSTASIPVYLEYLDTIRRNHGYLLSIDDYSDILYLRLSEEHTYPDLSEELANRIQKAYAKGFETVTELADNVKNKAVTRTHVDRSLLHITLGLTSEINHLYNILSHSADGTPTVPFLRVLACREEALPLLGALGKKGISLIVRASDDAKRLSSDARTLYAFENAANDLYAREYKKATGILLPKDTGRRFLPIQ